MLEPAQEAVGVNQPRAGVGRNDVELRHHRERVDRTPAAQPRLAAAAHDLESLGDELDLANAAAAQLDVVVVVAMPAGAARALLLRLGADHLVQPAQRRHRVEVQILAEHERPHGRLQRLDLRGESGLVGEHRRRDHAPFQPGEALPLAALAHQVLLEHCAGHRQRPGVAVGPQPQVDAEHEAVGRHVRQRGGQLASEPLEELVVRQRARAAERAARRSLAAVVVDVDEVEVGRHVELAAPALAHRDHQQVLRHAGGTHGHAMHLRQFGRQRRTQPPHRQFGQPGHRAGHFIERRQGRDIAHDQPQHRLASQAAQGGAQRIGVRGGRKLGESRRQPRLVPRLRRQRFKRRDGRTLVRRDLRPERARHVAAGRQRRAGSAAQAGIGVFAQVRHGAGRVDSRKINGPGVWPNKTGRPGLASAGAARPCMPHSRNLAGKAPRCRQERDRRAAPGGSSGIACHALLPRCRE